MVLPGVPSARLVSWKAIEVVDQNMESSMHFGAVGCGLKAVFG